MNEIGWLMKDKNIEHRNFTQWKKKFKKKKKQNREKYIKYEGWSTTTACTERP